MLPTLTDAQLENMAIAARNDYLDAVADEMAREALYEALAEW